MIYPITLYGNQVLRELCLDIVEGDIDVKNLSEDMFPRWVVLDVPFDCIQK